MRKIFVAGVVVLLPLAFFAADRFLPASAPTGLRYEHDARGRVAGRTLPDGRMARYVYDASDRLVRVSYERPGRMTGHGYSSGDDVRYAYDAAGNRTEIADATGVTKYAYDELGRLSGVTMPERDTTSFAWDPWGRVHQLTYPDGATVRFEHDLAGNLVLLSDGHRDVRYDYDDAANRIVRLLPNGVETTYQRDAANRLAAITHRARGGALLAEFRYTHDDEGRVTTVEERTARGVARTRYDYDPLGRLIRVSGGGGNTIYAYDAIGNRVAETGLRGTVRYQYDAEGRLERAGDVVFAYDAFGNVVSREGGGKSVGYEYDDEGRLAVVKTDDKTMRYAYDGEGHRVSRDVDGKMTRYVHERVSPLSRVIADADEKGSLTRRYLLGNTRVGQTTPDGRVSYFLEDHLGSTRLVVDDAGRVTARYDYSPFGVPRRIEGNDETRFLFAGEEWDTDAGLLYLRARDYDPELGRFLSADPIDGRPDDPQTYNLYAYAANDPVNRVDPTGLQSYRPPPPPPPPPPMMNQWWYDLYRVHKSNYDIFGYQPRPWMSAGNFPPYTPYTGSRPPTLSWYKLPENPSYDIGSYQSRPWTNPPPPRIQSHHWTWYYGQHLLQDTLRGEMLWPDPRRPYEQLLRVGLMIDPRSATLLMFNDLLYYRAHGNDAGGAAVTAIPSLVEFLILGRAPHLSIPLELARKIYDPALEFAGTRYARQAYVALFPRESESRDPLSYLARFDPLLAGSLDRTRNIFFPPPGGGGGGLPLVGGVYLDQTARVIGEIGAITGAVYDPKTGRLILVGDRKTSLPPMRPDYFAAAMRAVYTDSPHEPGMTIDPYPENPHAPIMLVIFFGNTENTRLGWVMFEADRVMKGYSIGRDNVTRAPVQSRIAGYRSVTSMGLADPRGDTGLWSRFWLVPDPVTARVSDDGQSIAFDPIYLRVKTETMRWEAGRLVPAGNVRDEHAEAFAAHFTNHYDAYAAENPIYAELKQVTAAVAIAKWMKERGVPIDWNANRIMAGDPYPTPTTTPAAFDEAQKTWTDGLTVRSLRVSTFGGVEMTPTFVPQKGKEANVFRDRVTEAYTKAQRDGKNAFPVQLDGREYYAVALPSANQREVASYSLAESDLPQCAQRLVGLPGLTRSYDSLHNESTELGRSWSLLMPRLDFEDAGGEGSEYLTVEGDESTKVLVQRFVLSNAFGIAPVRFEESFVDQALHRIGFKPVGNDAFRGLYPEENAYRLFFANNDQALFDRYGRLVAMLTPKSRTLYDYDDAGRLAALHHSGDDASGVEVRYAYDGTARLSSIACGGEQVSYAYDGAGNLVSVRGSAGEVAYRYDARRLLTNVLLDGKSVVENRYDAAGRLIEQRSGDDRVTQTVETEANGGRVVRVNESGREGKRHYDAALRLVKEETPEGATRSYTYEGARVAAIDAALPGGAKTRVELDARGNVKAALDPRGVRFEMQYDEPSGLPIVMLVNGKAWARYRYDPQGRLAESEFEGGWRESYERDASGNVVSLRRTSPRGASNTMQLATPVPGSPAAVIAPEAPTIDASTRSIRRRSRTGAETALFFDINGLLTSVQDPLGNRSSYTYDKKGRLHQVRLPGGACREYVYGASGAVEERRGCGAG